MRKASAFSSWRNNEMMPKRSNVLQISLSRKRDRNNLNFKSTLSMMAERNGRMAKKKRRNDDSKWQRE
jgi:hypothetical protein